jgi:hypothetical protein
MKKVLFFLFLPSMLAAGNAFSFDLKGLQPLAPYGVFSTFSADSLPKGKSGIALGIERSRQPDYYRITNQFGYGITDNIEVAVTIPYVLRWQDSADGFEDMAVGVKHRFFDEGRYGPSVAYLISLSLHSGRDEFSTKGSIGGGIIVTKRVGPVTGHVNLLYSRPGTGKFRDDITFAAGIDFSAAHNFKILAELYGKKSYSGKVDRAEARFGYRFLTAENLYTTVGAGFDFKNRSPEYRLILSVAYLFPPEKKMIKKIYEEEE